MDEVLSKVKKIQEKKKDSGKVPKQKLEPNTNNPPTMNNSRANLLMTSMVLEDIREEKLTPNHRNMDHSKVTDLNKPSKSQNEI
jgi:hypothetical protein